MGSITKPAVCRVARILKNICLNFHHNFGERCNFDDLFSSSLCNDFHIIEIHCKIIRSCDTFNTEAFRLYKTFYLSIVPLLRGYHFSVFQSQKLSMKFFEDGLRFAIVSKVSFGKNFFSIFYFEGQIIYLFA